MNTRQHVYLLMSFWQIGYNFVLQSVSPQFPKWVKGVYGKNGSGSVCDHINTQSSFPKKLSGSTKESKNYILFMKFHISF